MATDLSDSEIIDRLTDLDRDDDIEVTSWEADFLESVLYRQKGISPRQREVALEMLDKYGGDS